MNQRIGDATRLEVEDLEFIKDRLEDHHPPGDQLHRDFPPLPELPAPAY